MSILVFTRADVAADERTRPLVTTRDLARGCFDADDEVQEVRVQNAHPRAGCATIELVGGDVDRVTNALDQQMALGVTLFVVPYAAQPGR